MKSELGGEFFGSPRISEDGKTFSLYTKNSFTYRGERVDRGLDISFDRQYNIVSMKRI